MSTKADLPCHLNPITHHASRITHPAFSLSIAGLSVMVACDDVSLVAELHRRYQAFPAGGTVQLTAHVHVAGQLRTSALLDTGTVFRDGVLHFAWCRILRYT